MCVACPDYVARCDVCRRMFFLLDKFCEHLTEELGTDDADHWEHFQYWHEDENCECVVKNWWPDKPRPYVDEDY